MKKIFLFVFVLLAFTLFGQGISVDINTSPLTYTIDGNLIVRGSTTLHAGMYFDTNSLAQTPIAGDTMGMVYMTYGDATGFTYTAGLTGSYTVAVGGKDGHIGIFITGTSLAAGNWIMIQDESGVDFTGIKEVTSVSNDTVYFLGTFSGTSTGRYQRPSTLTLTYANITNSDFEIVWSVSASCAGSPAGDIVDCGVFVNESRKVKTMARRTLSTGSVWGDFGGGGIVIMSTGDDVFLFFVSDDVNALTYRFGSFRVYQL